MPTLTTHRWTWRAPGTSSLIHPCPRSWKLGLCLPTSGANKHLPETEGPHSMVNMQDTLLLWWLRFNWVILLIIYELCYEFGGNLWVFLKYFRTEWILLLLETVAGQYNKILSFHYLCHILLCTNETVHKNKLIAAGFVGICHSESLKMKILIILLLEWEVSFQKNTQ